MRRSPFSAIALGLLIALAALPPTGAEGGPRIHPAVRVFMDTGSPGALDVIVAFHDMDGPQRLSTLDVAYDAIASAPLANARLTAAQLERVASWGETRSVYPNDEKTILLDESVALIGADRVWAGEGLRLGYDGTGVGVAVVDTGADGLHPDLSPRLRANYYVGGNPLRLGGEAPEGSSANATWVQGVQTDTEHGHGTHVAGTIAGTGAASGGLYKGVAPGADLYSFKSGAGASVLTWWAIRAFDWVIVNGDKEGRNVRVISNSWGGGDGSDHEPDDPVNIMSKAAYDDGILVVFAASNSGGPDQLNQYATSPYVVSVGAVDKQRNLATFSSTGRPGGDWLRDANGLYRPTVVAPGVDIVAPRSSAGVVMSTGTQATNPFYTAAQGTSMATPHVAGVIALMLQARPLLTPAQVISILEGTAEDLSRYETWEVGAGLVDAHAAVKAAERGKVSFPPLTNGKTPSYVLRSGSDFAGTVLPAGYTLRGTSNATSYVQKLQVPTGVEALYVAVGWERMTDNVYLSLVDPAGRTVAESAGLLDLGSVNFRTVAVTNPAAGEWVVRVDGRVNTVTDVAGFVGVYDENKAGATKPTGTPTTTTTEFTGTALPGADATSIAGVPLVYTSQWHEILVPAGATSVQAYIEWAESAFDIDLYVYDASGRLVGSSIQGSSSWERATVTTGDPMTGALVPGAWRIEVRSWLNVVQEYNGQASVTTLA